MSISEVLTQPVTEPVVDRWTGETLGRIVVEGAPEASRAVDAAEAALAVDFPVHRRSAVLAATSALVAAHAEELARSIQQETGKPITAARLEVSRAVGTLLYASEEARRLPAEAVPMDATEAGAGTMALTVAEPRGIVAAITPFNFSLNLVVHKIGPAIAAGCAVVFKPSDKAPLVARMLVEGFAASGLPSVRLNLVTGPAEPIVGAWLQDDRVAVITFTGSSAVGWKLKTESPRKLHILELGSNTAMYVHHDADLPRAVVDAVTAGFGNSGQACVSLQRLYVHADVLKEFTSRLVEAVAAVPAGDPTDEKTIVGPLVTSLAGKRVVRWIDDAVAQGAQLLTGGREINGVVAPTVITGVSPASPLVCEEVFGPVITVIAVDGLGEAIAAVNTSDFGLNAAMHKEVQVLGILGGSLGLDGTIAAYASGAVDPRPLIAATVGLADVPAVLSGQFATSRGVGPKFLVDPSH